ncbi:GNAT family N-acetyltransferase [Flavobacterium sp.]|uniref:GNAT family N-acetyltransferase n=1 Tax=Flavobacterium sp. TaxID=239 RepID=UPI00261D94FD|nr:GNAT family N-acetyltransferase [Flavobacterium sp.]
MSFVLETERLLMREFRASDNEALFAMDTNPNVHRYLGNQPLIKIEECDAYIKSIQKQYLENGIGRYVVILKETQEIIGWAGLKLITEPENNHVNFYDIGYRFAEAYWGKGYGYEAAKAWLDYGFNEMKIPAVYASAHIDNVGSNKILQKIGLKQNGQYLHYNMLCNWYELKP